MTSGSLLLFDTTLAITLVAVAAGVLLARDLFQGIVLFIVFGLLLAVSWCRLEAVDVALAEVAIGAGLTGALLLNTWAATRGPEAWRPKSDARNEESRIQNENPEAWKAMSAASPSTPRSTTGVESPRGTRSAILLVAPSILAACAMAAVVAPLAFATDTPRIAMDQAMPHSGVTNPVTAVLLNFRAYDTLLEVAVLLAAILAVIPLLTPSTESRNGTATDPVREDPVSEDPVFEFFVKWMVPITAFVAVYVLWTGTKAPGGAFQAAAMLCAAGVLFLVSGTQIPKWDRCRWRVLLTVGLALFLAMAFLGLLDGGYFLQYHAGWAGASIIFIETGLTVSLAFILIRLFSSSSPSERGADRTGSSRETQVTEAKDEKS